MIALLRKAKERSDKRDYGGKHAILRNLIRQRPDEFHEDSRKGGIVGITHRSGFKIHAVASAVPALRQKTAERVTTHTHVDPDGSAYDVSALFRRLAGREPESVALDTLHPSRSRRDGFSAKRLAAADTSYPGIIREDGTLFDGRHRTLKLKSQGETHGQFHRVSPDDLESVKLAALLGAHT